MKKTPKLLAWCVVIACSLAAACGSHVNWPKVLSCGDQLEQPLIDSVTSVLAGTGEVKSELEQIAIAQTPTLVECAVQQIVGDLADGPKTTRSSHVAERGRAFLDEVKK